MAGSLLQADVSASKSQVRGYVRKMNKVPLPPVLNRERFNLGLAMPTRDTADKSILLREVWPCQVKALAINLGYGAWCQVRLPFGLGGTTETQPYIPSTSGLYQGETRFSSSVGEAKPHV